VLRLDVNRERREAAIVSGAELILRNVFRGSYEIVADFFRRFYPWVLRIDNSDKGGRLLAIFDVFDGWLHKKTFEGCSFINVLLESDVESPVRRAAAIHLAKIRAIIHGQAKEARLRNPETFAQAWHMLMKGSIISTAEGNKNAARDAKRAARLILHGWARKS
jgi:hypothetical protein